MKFIRVYLFLFTVAVFIMLLQVGCEIKAGGKGLSNDIAVNEKGITIESRYPLQKGFQRIDLSENSFGMYLRRLPLKEWGTKVHYFNGGLKEKDQVYESVIDMEIGKKDLQQCADAVIRLRAEYLFQQKKFDQIHFNFTNGFRADYVKWRDGYRIKVEGNKVSWVKQTNVNSSYESFRQYLDVVFTYAGTRSLSKELIPKPLSRMECGDVFIQGGSPGHAVLVVDMMENSQTKQRYFMLLQSYMPAQDIQVLLNPNWDEKTVWYVLDTSKKSIQTPEWRFTSIDLKTFE